MKGVSAIAVGVVALCSTADAFSANSAFSGSSMSNVVSNKASMTMEYIPSGMSKEQWMKMKNAEKNKSKGKNLGASGITTFQSRSFAEWQKAGGKNLFPVDPRNVKDASEIPYMQRPGGKPDGSDLKKGKGGINFFAKKEKAPAPAPEAPKKNWWTL